MLSGNKMLNRRLFNAIVGTIPFIGIKEQEKRNELAEYILNEISKQHAIENVKAIGIEWLHYSVKGPTWFYFQLKDSLNVKTWIKIPLEFNTGLDNLMEVSNIIYNKGIECPLIFVDRGYCKSDELWYTYPDNKVEVSI